MPKGVIETDRFVLFWGGWPSQWCSARFTVDGTTYNCCEQFMMAEKARVFGDERSLERVLAATSPRDQKAIGRTVRDFDERTWNGVCRGIVYTGNLARFNQDSQLRSLLLDTGEKTIVEASPTDRIWGIGLASDDPDARRPDQWRGRNWLGIALMQVRDTLRRSAPGETVDPADPELLDQLSRRRALRPKDPVR